VTVSYTATFLPAAIVGQPQYQSVQLTEEGLATVDHKAHGVYGLSVLPVGFTFDFGQGRVRQYAETHGGILASGERIPIDGVDATGLNFLFDFGAGLRWAVGPRRAFRIGYRFVHVSNAERTPFNPGLDNNVLYASFSFLR
jgi:hypothetical protein